MGIFWTDGSPSCYKSRNSAMSCTHPLYVCCTCSENKRELEVFSLFVPCLCWSPVACSESVTAAVLPLQGGHPTFDLIIEENHQQRRSHLKLQMIDLHGWPASTPFSSRESQRAVAQADHAQLKTFQSSFPDLIYL
jgi:hypothetical protein